MGRCCTMVLITLSVCHCSDSKKVTSYKQHTWHLMKKLHSPTHALSFTFTFVDSRHVSTEVELTTFNRSRGLGTHVHTCSCKPSENLTTIQSCMLGAFPKVIWSGRASFQSHPSNVEVGMHNQLLNLQPLAIAEKKNYLVQVFLRIIPGHRHYIWSRMDVMRKHAFAKLWRRSSASSSWPV